MKKLISFLILAFFASAAFGQSLDSLYQAQGFVKVTVKAVHDGDGCKVQYANGKTEWIRFVGVDAPEVFSPYVLKTQPYGRESGDSLRQFIKGKIAWLDTLATQNSRDEYYRLQAEVYVNDVFLPLHLVEKGWAWAEQVPLRKNKSLNRLLKQAQAEAKASKAGLFGQPGRALRPDTWRKKYGR